MAQSDSKKRLLKLEKDFKFFQKEMAQIKKKQDQLYKRILERLDREKISRIKSKL